MTSSVPLVFGNLLPPEFLLAHHLLAGDVHPRATDECCALASAYCQGLKGKSTIHPGAGFGPDIWSAYNYGAQSSLGLEINPTLVEFGNALTLSESQDIFERISHSPLIGGLYGDIPAESRPLLSCEDITLKVLEKLNYTLATIQWSRNQLSMDNIHPATNIHLYDIRNKLLLHTFLAGKQYDAAIANFLLHCLVGPNNTTSEALELIAPMIKPNGWLVVSLPSQVVQLSDPDLDEEIQRKGVFQNLFYINRCRKLKEILQTEFGQEITLPNRPPMRICENDLKSGSESFEHVSSYCHPIMSPFDSEPDVFTGLLMFEAVFATKRPAVQLIDFVRTVMTEKPVEQNYSVGIHVHFHIYRRR